MDIVIPTRGRWDLKLTCDTLPRELRKNVWIVCPSTETNRHRDVRPWLGDRIVPQPDNAMTIAKKRAWIMRTWGCTSLPHRDRIVMLDDDLRFFVKREDDPKRLRTATEDDVILYFEELAKMLGPKYVHAGFGSRLFNNAKEPGWEIAKRMQYVLGYYLPIVRQECDLSGRIETREDMDYVLQLLRKGHPNAVCHTLVVEQSNDYAARGGCSGQRTTASSDADAERLAELHPGLVRVVQKNYKGSPRKEVVVRWEAALREGTERRGDASGRREARSEDHRSASAAGRAVKDRSAPRSSRSR